MRHSLALESIDQVSGGMGWPANIERHNEFVEFCSHFHYNQHGAGDKVVIDAMSAFHLSITPPRKKIQWWSVGVCKHNTLRLDIITGKFAWYKQHGDSSYVWNWGIKSRSNSSIAKSAPLVMAAWTLSSALLLASALVQFGEGVGFIQSKSCTV